MLHSHHPRTKLELQRNLSFQTYVILEGIREVICSKTKSFFLSRSTGYQHESVVGWRTEVLFDSQDIFSVNNLVEN